MATADAIAVVINEDDDADPLMFTPLFSTKRDGPRLLFPCAEDGMEPDTLKSCCEAPLSTLGVVGRDEEGRGTAIDRVGEVMPAVFFLATTFGDPVAAALSPLTVEELSMMGGSTCTDAFS
jgi:hypothetical protein